MCVWSPKPWYFIRKNSFAYKILQIFTYQDRNYNKTRSELSKRKKNCEMCHSRVDWSENVLWQVSLSFDRKNYKSAIDLLQFAKSDHIINVVICKSFWLPDFAGKLQSDSLHKMVLHIHVNSK